jgi:hypothetical protein
MGKSANLKDRFYPKSAVATMNERMRHRQNNADLIEIRHNLRLNPRRAFNVYGLPCKPLSTRFFRRLVDVEAPKMYKSSFPLSRE